MDSKVIKNDFMCSICRDEDELTNLMTCCSCKGTGAYVHFQCVKEWMQTSGRDTCNVCKTKYEGIEFTHRPKSYLTFLMETNEWQRLMIFMVFFTFLYYISFIGFFHYLLMQNITISEMHSTIVLVFSLIVCTIVSMSLINAIGVEMDQFNHWKRFNAEIHVIRKTVCSTNVCTK
ncbi:E3 ubiquitin-protein ligase MARCHF2-like [Oppia nitens]|uniref:E3 ubiquitin-protein ligase MARCHF2-like n=1 Tax=Oppia nitens TaxID=1686743 RepID=UPI0023DAE129|nr:E3 ubiquitin-protein ligase MARCHF2-like [Oppia nitens]